MSGIIWLWKHRHCWKQLKYLYEHRYSLTLALSTSKAEDAEEIRACLRDFDRVSLARPWKVEPAEADSIKTHCRGFAETIEKSGKVYPTCPIRKRKDRVPLLRPVPPRPKRRDV